MEPSEFAQLLTNIQFTDAVGMECDPWLPVPQLDAVLKIGNISACGSNRMVEGVIDLVDSDSDGFAPIPAPSQTLKRVKLETDESFHNDSDETSRVNSKGSISESITSSNAKLVPNTIRLKGHVMVLKDHHRNVKGDHSFYYRCRVS